jgi:release factor glutamine methyltransferase
MPHIQHSSPARRIILMTIDQAITEGARRLPGVDDGEKRRTARLLLSHILGIGHAGLLVRSKDPVSEEQIRQYFELVSRRISGEPVQYIIGHQEFFGFDFLVNPAVLIPRPETEFLVERILKLARAATPSDQYIGLPGAGAQDVAAEYNRQSTKDTDSLRCTGIKQDACAPSYTESTGAAYAPRVIVDVGTGSGCIAVALAKMIPDVRVIATDISHEALETARLNAQNNAVAHRVEFAEGDLFGSLEGLGLENSVDFIACNPPYVAVRDSGTLQREVRDFEPRAALFGGVDGLGFYRRLLEEGLCYLKPGGYLVCEIGYGQAEGVSHLADPEYWYLGDVTADLQQIPRVVTLRKKG